MAGFTQTDRNGREPRLFGPSVDRPAGDALTVTIDTSHHTYTVELVGDVRECHVRLTDKELPHE